MKKISQTKRSLLLFLIVLFAANSCQKVDAVSTDPEKSQPQSSNCYFAQYDDYGRLTYEYMKYNLAFVPPEKLLPAAAQSTFLEVFDSITTLVQGWTETQILDHFEVN